jgi:photosystem II stability/assembly factor-like uncharacterized protein
MRAGRTRSGTGVPGQPYTFYIGVCNGGVWKTTDAGRTWVPIFDSQPTNSIGAIAIAPSDPSTVYVGSGEGLQRPDLSVGDGIYKSVDAGKTWTHLGLRDAQQIPNIAVDPKNPNRLFVAALGHPYGPNSERGIFRSLDGGRTFHSVITVDENVGGNDVDIDPKNPNIVYATLWESRQGPWENSTWVGNGGGVFKSTNGGSVWTRLTRGLPDTVIQANLAIAPSNPSRIYATVARPGSVGLYRSDDAGESWREITKDTRPAGRIGGGDLPVPIVDPTRPDIVVMASTVSWRTADGGVTWAPFKGAPGGDDYQGGWINPNDPNIILLVSDQGAVVTLNGGESWSSWYNQPTAQLYHITADNAFPYRVCSGQQESGSACVSSRGDWGQITMRDWWTVGIDEYAYAAPDPLDPDLVYGGRNVTRFDRRTGQTSGVGPIPGGRGSNASAGGPPGTYRQVRTHPVVFSAADPKALYFGNNYLWKTVDGGKSWTRVSPDLTRTTYELPKSIGKYATPSLMTQRGVIYTIGPSPLQPDRLWVGTDDGLIHTTVDGGKSWQNVTPPQMGPFWKVFMIDAGHYDANTAYAAVNTLRLDDMTPHIFRTHDGGKTWTEIVKGMEGAGPANAVREDPVRKGLLFASTEKSVYVSFDDGNHWQSLRLNLPASSVRDLIVKDNDVAVATHGRGFWILDDITPLRQMNAETFSRAVTLFKPAPALRVRWNTNTDTPLPKDEPNAANPPEGAVIDYYLRESTDGDVTFEIIDASNRVVRKYSSSDPVSKIPDVATTPLPLHWYRQPQTLSTKVGMHRFYWDVRYQPLTPPPATLGTLPISAVPYNTVPAPTTPFVAPGQYTVRLTVNGKQYTQPITVKQDPRVRTPTAAMAEVFAITDSMYWLSERAQRALNEMTSVREQIAKRKTSATGAAAGALAAFDSTVAELQGQPSGPTNSPPAESLLGVVGSLNTLMLALTGADVPATENQGKLSGTGRVAVNVRIDRWEALKSGDLRTLNQKLKEAKVAEIRL